MNREHLKFVVFGAMLIAIAVVLKVFLGIPVNMFGSFAKDINLSPAVIIYSGIALGPVGGMIVGAATDLLAYIIRPLGGYFPLFTITSALMGLLPALFYRNRSEKSGLLRLSLTVVVTQTVCSALLNTIWLVMLGLPASVAPYRAIGTYISAPIYIAIIWALIAGTKRVKAMA